MINLSIPDYKVDTFKTKFKKLTKLCEKYKLEQPAYEFGKEWYLPVSEKSQFKIRMIDVTVNADVPRVNGWKCIAHIDHSNNQNFLFSKEQLPEYYRTVGAICEHCGTNRHRTDTYVLKNESGEYKQVGRNCLADFVRTSAESLLRVSLAIMKFGELEDEEDGERLSRGEVCADLDYYLASVKNTIEKYGWQSRNSDLPTANYVWENLFTDENDSSIQESHLDFANRVIEYFKNINTQSDYNYNCNLIAKSGHVKASQINFAASMVVAYQKHLDEQITDNLKKSEFVGNIKERLDLLLNYTGTNAFESQYGITFLHKFIDNNGNKFTWFTSNNIDYYLQEASNYDEKYSNSESLPLTLKATVKDHKLYKGEKQTVLTRCKVLELN